MIRFLCLIILLLSLSITKAQVTDSIPQVRVDTVPVQEIQPPQQTTRQTAVARPVVAADSVLIDSATLIDSNIAFPFRNSYSMRPIVGRPWKVSSDRPFFIQILQKHPFFDFVSRPVVFTSELRVVRGKEAFFYVLAAIILVFALLRQGFGKYFNDLFRVFFQTTMKQRQIREQLMQTPFPSLVFNTFFIASAGLYVDFMLYYFKLAPVDNFWLLYLYCCIALTLIYLGKFIGLKVLGWLFNIKRAADSYIFIVFIINKVIGIFVLPFLIILAFAGEPLYSSALVLSWCGIGALFLYRFILGFAAIRNEVRFNLFHFFLYLFAFEITPLLLIYKLLLLIF